MSCAAGGPHASYDDAEAATAAEAEAAEAEDLLDALLRVRSELAADMDLAQSILQLALIGARAGDEAIVGMECPNGGGTPSPRPAEKLRGGSVVNEHGLPPLHVAAKCGHTSIVRLLLDAAAGAHTAVDSRHARVVVRPVGALRRGSRPAD